MKCFVLLLLLLLHDGNPLPNNRHGRQLKGGSKSKGSKSSKGSSKSGSNDKGREEDQCPLPGTNHRQTVLLESNATWTLSSSDGTLVSHKHHGIVVSLSGNGQRLAVLSQLDFGRGVVRVWQQMNGEWRRPGNALYVAGSLNRAWWRFLPNMISLSGNGRYLAIASPFASGTRGRIDVYEYKQGFWRSNGGIAGIMAPSAAMSVALSVGGHFLAVATDRRGTATDNGFVRVYMRMNNNEWIQMGNQDIVPLPEDENNIRDFGVNMAYSKSGNRIAVGFNEILPDGTLEGRVRVYAFSMNTWPQHGRDIKHQGGAFALDYQGDTLIIGTTVYRYIDNDWVGPEAVREPSHSGSIAVAISRNGSRVAIANPLRRENIGRVQIFDYMNGVWCRIVHKLGRENGRLVNYGYSVALSDDGTRYAAGAPEVQYLAKNASYFQLVQVQYTG